MSFLEEKVWKQFADEIGAEFIKGGLLGRDKVVARMNGWTITLDTFAKSSGQGGITYTRIRAPYVNKDGFRFTIYRKRIFRPLGELFGRQDIQIGDPEFDRDFIIKANDEVKVRELFANPRIRQLIQCQPDIFLKVEGTLFIKDNGGVKVRGLFDRPLPGTAVDELYFQVEGFIDDSERLRSLFQLFAETLNQLVHISSASEDQPHVVY